MQKNPLETVKNLSHERWLVIDRGAENSAPVGLEKLLHARHNR